MSLLDKIVEGCSIVCEGATYRVLSKALYVTKNEPESVYSKILLDKHYVLVIVPDEVLYFGKNVGRLPEFDCLEDTVNFNGTIFKRVNHDYQIRTELLIGTADSVEGDVEFWDYEDDSDGIISIAMVANSTERADVVAKYIPFDAIKIT